MISAAE
jgi:hypothetical protein